MTKAYVLGTLLGLRNPGQMAEGPVTCDSVNLCKGWGLRVGLFFVCERPGHSMPVQLSLAQKQAFPS